MILTVGQPDAAGSRGLLDAHGLALLPRPMGTVSPVSPTASRRERESHPRFLDAWPIVAADGRDLATEPGVEIIYRHGDDVIALFHRVGRGGLLLISDTAILLRYERRGHVRLLAREPSPDTRLVSAIPRRQPGCGQAFVPFS